MRSRFEEVHIEITLESDILMLHPEAKHKLTCHVINLTQKSIKETMIAH